MDFTYIPGLFTYTGPTVTLVDESDDGSIINVRTIVCGMLIPTNDPDVGILQTLASAVPLESGSVPASTATIARSTITKQSLTIDVSVLPLVRATAVTQTGAVNVNAYVLPIPANSAVDVIATFRGTDRASGDTYRVDVSGTWSRRNGDATEVMSPTSHNEGGTLAGASATLILDGTNIIARATGPSGHTVDWVVAFQGL